MTLSRPALGKNIARNSSVTIKLIGTPVSFVPHSQVLENSGFASVMMSIMSTLIPMEQKPSEIKHGTLVEGSSMATSGQPGDSHSVMRNTQKRYSRRTPTATVCLLPQGVGIEAHPISKIAVNTAHGAADRNRSADLSGSRGFSASGESTRKLTAHDQQQAPEVPEPADRAEVREETTGSDNGGESEGRTFELKKQSTVLFENPDNGIAPTGPVLISPTQAMISNGDGKAPEIFARSVGANSADESSHQSFEAPQPRLQMPGAGHNAPAELRVQLRPETLGQVEVSVQMQKSKIEARLWAGTPNATAMLQLEQLVDPALKQLTVSVVGPIEEVGGLEDRALHSLGSRRKLRRPSS